MAKTSKPIGRKGASYLNLIDDNVGLLAELSDLFSQWLYVLERGRGWSVSVCVC